MRVRVGGSQEARARLMPLALAAALMAALPLGAQNPARQPELVIESQHSSGINRILCSKDGRVLVAGSKDGRIRIFDAVSMLPLRELAGSNTPVQALALQEGLLASASEDSLVRLWDHGSGKLVRTLGGHLDRVNAIAFSPDGQRLASASSDGTVRVWDPANGALLKILKPGLGDRIVNLANEVEADFYAVRFLPDGKRLVAGGSDKRILIWDWEAGVLQRAITGLPAAVTVLTLTRDPNWLVAGLQDGLVRLYRMDTAGIFFDLISRELPVHGLAFSPEGNTLAVGMASSNTERRSAASGATVRRFKGLVADRHDVAFSPDGKQFVTGGHGNQLAVWDAAEEMGPGVFLGRRLARFQLVEPPGAWLLPSSELSDAVAFVPVAWDRLQDYRRLTDRRASPAVRSWQAADAGWQAYPLDASRAGLRSRDANAALVTIPTPSPSTAGALRVRANRLVLGDPAGAIRVFDLTGREVATWKAGSERIGALAVSPAGDRVAAAMPGIIGVYETSSGKQVHSLTVAAPVSRLVFSPDGTLLLSEAANGKRLWSIERGTAMADFSVLNEDRDWVAATPRGAFDASPGGMQNAGWRFEDDRLSKYPLELFLNEYFQPGLLKSVLDGIVPETTTAVADVDRRQPRVAIALEESATGRQLMAKLRLKVEEAAPAGEWRNGSGARDLRLFRNGVLVKLWRGELAGKGAATLPAEVALVPGDNLFQAYAFNRANVKSSDATAKVAAPKDLRRAPVLHLLLIGVSRYANPEFNLEFAVKDVEAIRTALGGTAGGVQVTRLADAEATKERILAALGGLSGEKQGASARPEPQDSVVIYFAGHGIANRNRFFLIPHDLGFGQPRRALRPDNIDVILQHSISDRELEDLLEHLDVSRLALVIDACHAGQVLEADERRRGPLNVRGLAQLAYEKGMYVLAAAQSFQAALEAKSLGHGYLTFALLEGIGGPSADQSPRDGVLSMAEWMDYGVERVPDLHRQQQVGLRNLVAREESVEGSQVQRPRAYYRREMETESWIVRFLQQSSPR